jgi:hypothetical protein
MHSILVIRPVHIIANELDQKDVFMLFLPFDAVSQQVTGIPLLVASPAYLRNCNRMSQLLSPVGMRIA